MSDGSIAEHPMHTLLTMITAHYRFTFLAAAVRFDLFNMLAKEPGLSRAAITKKLGIEPQPARILLLGCTTYKLLRKQGDAYFLTPVSELTTKNPTEIPFVFIPFEDRVNFKPMGWLYESLKENTNTGLLRTLEGTSPTLYGRLADKPELEQTFHNMMSAVTRTVARQLVELVDFSKVKRLLDVGGGAAVNARAIAQRWPNVEVTILDLPSVAQSAAKLAADAGLGDRIKTVGCNALEDEFPTGFDFVLLSHFLPIWSPERNRKLLGRAYRALNPQGRCLLVHPVQDNDETGPELAATLSAYFHNIASGEGMVYTNAEYEEWLREAGFRILPERSVTELGESGATMLGQREVVHGVVEAIKD